MNNKPLISIIMNCYNGELYLKMKLPKQAKKLLIRLEELCVLNCVERDKLKKAINEFENN